MRIYDLVQVDVIEAQSSILSHCIANAQYFSEAERAHQTFLDAVVTQSFLDMKAISQMLEGIFNLCQRLCGFVQVSTQFPCKRPKLFMKVAFALALCILAASLVIHACLS